MHRSDQYVLYKEISYKTVERLYSDPDVFVILYNLFSKTVGGLKIVMDGTGYSLVVTKHYRSKGSLGKM